MYTTKEVDGQTAIVPLEEGTRAFAVLGTRRPPVKYSTYVLHLGTGSLVPLMRAIAAHPKADGIVVYSRRDLRALSAAFPGVAVFYMTSLSRVLLGTAVRVSASLQDVFTTPAAFPVAECLLSTLGTDQHLVLMYRGRFPERHLIQSALCSAMTSDDLDRLLDQRERTPELTLTDPHQVLEVSALDLAKTALAVRRAGSDGTLIVHDSFALSVEGLTRLGKILYTARHDGARVILTVRMDAPDAPSVVDVMAWVDTDAYDPVSFDSESPLYRLAPVLDGAQQLVGVSSQDSTGAGFNTTYMTRLVRTYPVSLDPETEVPTEWSITRRLRGSLLAADGSRVLLETGNPASAATLLEPTEERVHVAYADQTDGEKGQSLKSLESGSYIVALSGTAEEWVAVNDTTISEVNDHPLIGPSLQAYSGTTEASQNVLKWNGASGVYSVTDGRVDWVMNRKDGTLW